MKKRYWAFLIGSWCLSVGMQAAKVDTLSVHSDAMNKEVQVITICPDKAMAGEKCPVLYLLHGYGGNAGTWLGIKPELPRIADKEGIIFVCPDGKNSWYWDSPLNKEYRYETFVSKELVNYIDKNFTTKDGWKAACILLWMRRRNCGYRIFLDPPPRHRQRNKPGPPSDPSLSAWGGHAGTGP